jgi:hypothetical protein
MYLFIRSDNRINELYFNTVISVIMNAEKVSNIIGDMVPVRRHLHERGFLFGRYISFL